MTEVVKRGFPGIKSVKDLPILQDTPPPGGFPAIRIDRRLPSTGPAGATIFAVGAVVSAYGYYKLYHHIQQRKADRLDLELTRAPVIPVLQAEDDIKWVARRKVELDEESRVMKHVPGWVVGASVSSTGRYIPDPRPAGIWDPMLQ